MRVNVGLTMRKSRLQIAAIRKSQRGKALIPKIRPMTSSTLKYS
jgi:hypothetical protein